MSDRKRQRDHGSRRGFPRSSSKRRHVELIEDYIDIPDGRLGLVIGKGGSTLQWISTNTGARVFIKGNIQNRVFIKAETERMIERAKQKISRIANSAKRRSTASVSRTYTIDRGWLGGDGHLRLKRMRVPGQDGKFFRLIAGSTEEESKQPMESNFIAEMIRTAEEVLHKLRQDANERPKGSPLEIDVWIHLGHLLFKNVDDREADVPLSASTVLSKTNKDRDSWSRMFEGGVVGLDIDWLHQVLGENADSDQCRTSVRHDIGFYTPSLQTRYFKVWIAKAGTKDAGIQQVEDVYTGIRGSRGIGSAVVKAGPGILCTPLDPRLLADIALPCHNFDCRLAVKSGVRDTSLQKANEKCEDDILTREFCEKVLIDGTDLILPRQSRLPDGYRMHFKRKCERRSYSVNGFELTTSRETSVRYDAVDRSEQSKVDVHVHNMECDALLDQNEGRDWKPQDIVQLFPKMVQFVKEDLELLE